MFYLYYQDAQERAQVLVSLAYRCQPFGARLVFLGSEVACEATRRAVQELGATPAPSLSFRPVDFLAGESGNGQAWEGAVENIRRDFAGISALSGPVLAWVESPLPRNSVTTGKALSGYHDALERLTEGTALTLISASRLTDVAAGSLLALLEGPNALIGAKKILLQYPSCLAARTTTDFTPVEDILAQHSAAVPLFTPMFQAEKLAALGQLAAGVAHELGNPLSIISSSLQYLHQQLAAANDPASDFASMALRNVERMHELLRNMLDFAGVRKPCFEHADLKEFVSEIVRFTSPEYARHGIAIDISFDPSVPKTWVDARGIKQILLNVVKNALEAMTQGGNTLRLRTRIGSSRTAVIEIENNGPAIAAEALQNLFRPFHTTKEGGTGLGLYLSRQIARDHGGELKAENLERAVRFTLTLPLDRRSGE